MVLSSIRRYGSERGASLIELAVILPLAMLLVAGLLDVGFKISTVKTISLAARHAARIAASHSRSLSNPRPCGPDIDEVCPAALAPTLITSQSVTAVARDAACNFLLASKLDPTDWRITVVVSDTDDEDSATFLATNVTITRATSECLVCYDRHFATLRSESSSSFILEAQCQ